MAPVATMAREKAALADVVSFPEKLRDMSARALGVSIGRWKIVVNCRHGSFLLGGSQAVTYGFDLDFPDVRQAAYGVRDIVEDQLLAVWPAVSGVQDWIGGFVPRISEALQSLTAGSAADQAGQQRELASLAQLVRDGGKLLEAGATALREASTKQLALEELIGGIHDRLCAEAYQRLDELLEVLDQHPCGHKDALRQFARHQAELGESLRIQMAVGGQVRFETLVAQHAVEVLSASAAILRGEIEALAVRTGTPYSPPSETETVAAMLAELASTWQDFAASATSLLEGRPILSPFCPPSVRERSRAHRD